MKSISLVIVASAMALSACASTPWPWHPDASTNFDPPCEAATCTSMDAQNALSAASNYCIALINRDGGSKALIGGSQVALSTIGAVSGGVIAQFAEGSASQAWAGVAGATNGVRSTVDQAFAGAIYVQRKKLVADAARKGVAAVLAAPADKPGQRVDLAMKMATECASAAAEADAKVLQAISAG